MTDAERADRAAIARATEELLAAVNASDVDRILAVWTDDAVLMPPHHPSAHGKEALWDYFRSLFARSKFRFAFTSSDIQLAGDIALERVTYTVTVWSQTADTVTEDAGKGLHVYRRQTDGSWKLTQDIWNSDRSPD